MESGYLYNFEERLSQLLEEDKTSYDDLERKSLFYIIAGNNDLYSKVKSIYDFKEHSIKSDCLNSKKVDFCTSSKKLIELGFNLFNGNNKADVLDTFSSLDENNFNLAIEALKIRLNK